ncbi:DUF4232 domain-containing protein [Streptomyces sp. NPDC088747]|uniref:DUF4232 domain-containing protein n=1 Tax=Streptomyces sp. NPDC088747 TaxID=3365886 RepID=UPI00380441D5
MSGKRRKALLVSAVLVGGVMLMTGCQDSDNGGAQSSPPADPVGVTASPNTDGGQGGADGSGADTGDGEREQVQQNCGAHDISWSTRSETQAGGYILLMAKAKPGITCVMPAALPTVAFGSDGTDAGPAEQAVGEEITLSGSTTAYAGVSTKTTGEDGGKELDTIIVGVGDDDPDPVSLSVGTITVEDPIVTNWHTVPTDAVPFS